MSSALSIATSGMAAASLRLDVAASNIANMQSTGPLPASGSGTASPSSGFAAYVPLTVDQVSISGGSGPSGTSATVSTVSPSFVPRSDPSAPFADQNGLVAAPNVDLTNEVVQTVIAKYEFATNAKVAKTASDMSKSLLDVLT
jgi:flagellar basal-body rod protein FlgC